MADRERKGQRFPDRSPIDCSASGAIALVARRVEVDDCRDFQPESSTSLGSAFRILRMPREPRSSSGVAIRTRLPSRLASAAKASRTAMPAAIPLFISSKPRPERKSPLLKSSRARCSLALSARLSKSAISAARSSSGLNAQGASSRSRQRRSARQGYRSPPAAASDGNDILPSRVAVAFDKAHVLGTIPEIGYIS